MHRKTLKTLPRRTIRGFGNLRIKVRLLLDRGLICPSLVGLIAVLLIWDVDSEPVDHAERMAEVHRQFAPPVVRSGQERRVICSAKLDAICDSGHQRRAVERWLTDRGAVVLNADQPGLTLHFFADGIEAMSRVDRAWEGLPQRAQTIQHLIDEAIHQAREARRPITHLIIAGHAGLPGCATFGGTLDDCVFDGRVTDYQRAQLVRLRPYLAKDAEIELRQCTTGSGPEGKALLTTLHRTTGASASSYLGDFYFGLSDRYPRIVVDAEGVSVAAPRKKKPRE